MTSETIPVALYKVVTTKEEHRNKNLNEHLGGRKTYGAGTRT